MDWLRVLIVYILVKDVRIGFNRIVWFVVGYILVVMLQGVNEFKSEDDGFVHNVVSLGMYGYVLTFFMLWCLFGMCLK